RGGFSVRYQRLTRLLDELALARVDGKATRLLAPLARIQLLIIDDWAMARLTAEQRRDLMEVIDDRHQRASTILATQIPIERWHDTIGEPMISWCLCFWTLRVSGPRPELCDLTVRQADLPRHTPSELLAA